LCGVDHLVQHGGRSSAIAAQAGERKDLLPATVEQRITKPSCGQEQINQTGKPV
jgi:hypothetical protein